ncbi:Tetratricopeptide TPR_2 [Beggiatoa sp. PS]|nr:Tetratricopeptide TPR_2 [Beggiatoa sp. PS]
MRTVKTILKIITITIIIIVLTLITITVLVIGPKKVGQIIKISQIYMSGLKAYNIANYPTAIKKWEQGLNLTRLIKYRQEDGQVIAKFLVSIGVAYKKSNQYQKALIYFQQSLKIYRKINDKHEIKKHLLIIGVTYYKLRQYQKSLNYYQQSLKIYRKIGDRRGEISVLYKISMIYNNLGQYKKTLSYYQQALEINRKIDDNIGIAVFLTQIGIVYTKLGQYQQALNYYQQILEINLKTDDEYGKSVYFNNTAVVYLELGQYQKALDYYKQSLEINRKIDNKSEIGKIFGNLGNIYNILGQYQKALAYYRRALEIEREIGDKLGEGASLNNIGVLYGKLGKYQKKLDYHRQALVIAKEIGDENEKSSTLINIGAVYYMFGKFQKAKDTFQDCVTVFETTRSVDLYVAQQNLAFIEAKLNQPELAIQHYKQALDNIEKIRNLLTKEHKTSFMRNKIRVYDELITLLQSQHSKQPNKGYDRKAFETFERKQGRLFLEEMGQSGARRFVGLDNDIIFQEQSLILKWQKLKAQPFTPQEHTALEQAEVRLEKRIKAEYPKYYALKYPQPVDLRTLQNHVLQKGEMMLVYGVLRPEVEKKTVLWVIGKQHFQMFTLPVDEDTTKTRH